ncbi:hypothetical protein [Sphingobacterium wenxiniae]|uniref:Uncharacterized protein n=1 Tax=Sphingobacterium wenxiniae TaxID=683125 RepID=A0A1I6U199_9SPHI|nr:hypothetical protein [Sphingobacterium wenxiniae]SFS95128.1 hypothetical protein SAMN05660206_107191 [Sphingobacterium wenxiniae]
MAIVKNGFLRGQVGNLVNRKVGNQQVVQTKPGRKIKQSKSTKAAAEDFGYSSSMGALLRQAFVNTHMQLHDDKMHNRLIQHIRRVMRSTPKPRPGLNTIESGNLNRLIGFQFNRNCHLHDYMYVDPILSISNDKQVSVHFPAFQRYQHLYIPKDCYYVTIQVETIGFTYGAFLPLGTQEIEIYTGQGQEEVIPEQQLIFDIPKQQVDIILVGLNIIYSDKMGNRNFVRNTKELHPAAIIGGFV